MTEAVKNMPDGVQKAEQMIERMTSLAQSLSPNAAPVALEVFTETFCYLGELLNRFESSKSTKEKRQIIFEMSFLLKAEPMQLILWDLATGHSAILKCLAQNILLNDYNIDVNAENPAQRELDETEAGQFSYLFTGFVLDPGLGVTNQVNTSRNKKIIGLRSRWDNLGINLEETARKAVLSNSY